MRELLVLTLILFVVRAHAKPTTNKQTPPTQAKSSKLSNKKLKLTPPGQVAQTTEDPGSATRLLYEDPRNKNSLTAGAEKKTPQIGVKSTCTDSMGMIYKQGDSGFEGCLRSYNRTAPNLPGDNKRPPSVGFTIGQ